MPEDDIITLLKNSRTEEVNDIIQKMPTGFGRWITLIVLFIVLLMGISGWVIKYPDVVTGQITVNALSSPLILVANTSGKLELEHFSPKDPVKEGNFIAVIQNPARTKDVRYIDSLLQLFNPNDSSWGQFALLFPQELSLGEMNVKYYAFLSALYEITDYLKKNLFEKEEIILDKLISNQNELVKEDYNEKEIQQKSLDIQNKSFSRDSLLNQQKVIADAEFEKSKMSKLAAIKNYQSLDQEITANLYKIEDARNQLQQLQIQKSQKEKTMKLALLNAYYDLKEDISLWEQKYVLKSPINGRVEFLKFWQKNQFVQAGEEIFAIVPPENAIIGQVWLPESGSGKVKPGQEAIIKLDNYPYIEYGSVKGVVQSISLVTNSQQAIDNNGKKVPGAYLVRIKLPKGLTTNYGTKLNFKFDAKGTAEIITKDRRLIERLFDNLKYIASKGN